VASVTFGPDGNLYGTTLEGGLGYGTVYKLSPPPSVCKTALCPWVETILYQFSGGSDGKTPNGPVIFDQAGNLYGITGEGGTADEGVVYELSHSQSGWTESVLHSFTGAPDGKSPTLNLLFDSAGNLYGTTYFGGTAANQCGTVFELIPSGSGWTESLPYSFPLTTDGCNPVGLVLDASGNLYGSTNNGGPNNEGTIYELVNSAGSWTYNQLYAFPDLHFGIEPNGPLTFDASGNLWGTTYLGGIDDCGGPDPGCGTVFELLHSNGQWSFVTVHEFDSDSNGSNPVGAVAFDSAGDIYGATNYGGSNGGSCDSGDLFGCGVIFEITP
jgi:uncharacterized repeat protein (TIGR03803 family)